MWLFLKKLKVRFLLMRRLGFSVYPQHSETSEITAYIELAHKYGFTRIFTCLISLDSESERQKMKDVNKFAADLGIEVIADVAPEVFEDLGIDYTGISKLKEEYHLAGIRLDMGFSGHEEAIMSLDPCDLKIELNVSIGTKYLETILSYQANRENIIGCHNFYPRPYTALSRKHFTETSKMFKDHGIKTAAMISSQHAAYGPWDAAGKGLPTLEEHRGQSIIVQAKDLWQTGLIDDLIIGNMYASEAELKALGELNRYKLEFDVVPAAENNATENIIMFEEPHHNRGDVSAYVVRSTQSRVKYKNESFEPHNTTEIKAGDVTIDNNGDSRYKGEMNVALQTMENTGTTNIVGHIVPEELYLLERLQPWESFGLREKK